MHLSERMDYDADVATAYAMHVDPEYARRRGMIARATDVEVSVTVDPDTGDTIVDTRRKLPAEVPAYAKGLVGDAIPVHEVHRWYPDDDSGSRNGDFDIEFVGLRVRFTGTLVIAPDGEGSYAGVDGEVKASIPLVGRKIEGFVHDEVSRAIGKESALGNDWLSGRR